MTNGDWCGIGTPQDTMQVSTDLQSSFAPTCLTRVDVRHRASNTLRKDTIIHGATHKQYFPLDACVRV